MDREASSEDPGTGAPAAKGPAAGGFADRVVLITGGGSGMGRLAARNLAAQGARVAAFDVNADGLRETAEGRPAIRTWTVDVTEPAAVEGAVKEAERARGPIDRVYNAAAIMPLGRLLDQELSVIHRIMRINYEGVVNVAKLTLPGMLERGHGDFVNFASLAGWVPALYMGAYNASKFAVVALSEVLYHENRGRGVRFACVCPPPVATPLLDQGRRTVWPKLLDLAPPIEPQAVLDAIEQTLAKDRFWVFPGRGTKLGWRLRRWLPGVLWRRIHQVEGC
jgi:NAD(P)-dependent dehydrogenase (short-subunit alcohol dehydrogenase family)